MLCNPIISGNESTVTSRPVGHVDIYGLYDPVTKKIRYIGKAKCAVKRLKGHLREKNRMKSPLYQWINKLKKSGHSPIMKVISSVPEDSWRDAEMLAIKFFRDNGERLLNVADGGDEPFCSHETRVSNGYKTSQNRNQEKMKAMVFLSNYLRSEDASEKIKDRIRSNPELFSVFKRYL